MSILQELDTLKLYQFGNFVFPSEDGKQSRDLGIKNFLDTLDYGNGQIRVNKFNQDFTEDTFYEIEFTNIKYTKNQLDKIFYSKPQKMYFVEEYPNINGYLDYRVYFAYGSVYKASKIELGCSDMPDNYSITLRQIGRRYLIEDNRLQFIKFDDLFGNNQSWGVDNGTLWGYFDGNLWGDIYNGKAKSFNQLSYLDKQDLLSNCCEPLGIFDYKDLYKAQEVMGIDTTAKNYIEYNLAGSAGVTQSYIESTKQSANKLNLNSTATNETFVFEFEKDGTMPALTNGDWLEIVNNQTQAGFRITCLNNYTPALLSVFTHKSTKLYNTSNNQPINFLDPANTQNYLKWKIEIIGKSSKFFELSSFYPLYPFFETQDSETLIIKRNFTGNLKIKIANLPTFY